MKNIYIFFRIHFLFINILFLINYKYYVFVGYIIVYYTILISFIVNLLILTLIKKAILQVPFNSNDIS